MSAANDIELDALVLDVKVPETSEPGSTFHVELNHRFFEVS